MPKTLNLLNILYYYVQRCIASSNNSNLDVKSHLFAKIVSTLRCLTIKHCYIGVIFFQCLAQSFLDCIGRVRIMTVYDVAEMQAR